MQRLIAPAALLLPLLGAFWAPGSVAAQEVALLPPLEVVARLHDYGIDVEPVVVAPGSLRITVTNAGQRAHNLFVQDPDAAAQTADLLPGEAAALEVTLTRPGTYALFCDVAYHQQKGMVAVLTVETASGGP